MTNGLNIAKQCWSTYHWMQACKCRTDRETTEARFCDWTIDDSLLTEFVKKPFGDLVTIRMKQLAIWHEQQGIPSDGPDKVRVIFLGDVTLSSLYIRSIVLGYFFPEHENLVIRFELLGQCLIQCISYSYLFDPGWCSIVSPAGY